MPRNDSESRYEDFPLAVEGEPLPKFVAVEKLEAAVAERDALRHLLRQLMDPRSHWAAGIWTRAKELAKD